MNDQWFREAQKKCFKAQIVNFYDNTYWVVTDNHPFGLPTTGLVLLNGFKHALMAFATTIWVTSALYYTFAHVSPSLDV